MIAGLSGKVESTLSILGSLAPYTCLLVAGCQSFSSVIGSFSSLSHLGMNTTADNFLAYLVSWRGHGQWTYGHIDKDFLRRRTQHIDTVRISAL